MNSNLLAVRPRWTNVAAVVSERLHKDYGGDYVQQVSAGTRINTKVMEILRELGVTKDQLSQMDLKPASKMARTSKRQAVAA